VIKENNIWVFSDEVYAELTYEGKHTALASLPGMKDCTITLSGFSKSFAMTGWRIGFIAAPKELMSRVVKLHQYCAMCAPIMAQYGALEALEHSKTEMENMCNSYKQRRNLVYKGFKDMGLDAPYPDGAFYIFVDIRKTKLSSEKFAIDLLNKQKVAVVPGNVFGLGGEGYIRCSYATDISSLKEALRRIKEFIK
jgi:aminotransferase